MSDLHARIIAAIDQAERDAREDYQRGGGGHWAMFALHGLAEDRDILRRHVASYEMPKWPPGAPEESQLFLCAGCHGKRYLHECPELLSLARRHGIDPEDTPGEQP